MARKWMDYMLSFVLERPIERATGPVAGDIEVYYMFGKYVIDGAKVNYGYGNLDRVFRESFRKIRLDSRGYRDILLLGLGAGNVPAILEQDYPAEYRITGVEADPEMIRLGKKYFGLGERRGLKIVNRDAAEFVASPNDRYDLIIVDLFVDELVPQFAEQDAFLRRLGDLLRPNGMLLFNRLGHTPELADAALVFFKRMQALLPGTDYFLADKNIVIRYMKKG